MTRPLDGTRVLDLSQAIAGPFAGRMLSDLGADVVKVIWPRGDVSNAFGHKVGDVSGLYLQMNAGKRGISIDLTNPEGVALIRRLAAEADIVIENFRPGVLDRAGLGYDVLRAAHPGLVMLSVSGFGATGPEAHRQAYAPVLHAESGLLARQEAFDERPATDAAMALADSLAALHGTVALLAALTLRARTGTGQHIDLSMLEAFVATDDYIHYAIDRVYDIYPQRGRIWPAVGGPVMIATDPKALWSRVAKHTGIADPAPDADLQGRISARSEAVGRWIASFDDRPTLIAALVAADLAWADVRTAATVLDSPSLQAGRVVAEVDDGQGGTRGVVRMPYRFSDAECEVRGGAPVPVTDGPAVLADWLGLTPDDIVALRSQGAYA